MNRLAVALALALLAGGCGGAAAAPTSSAPTANLYIDTSGGSCARQATAGDYADDEACASLKDAYAAAHDGDVVRVRPGRYGEQLFADGAGATESPVRPIKVTLIGDPSMRHMPVVPKLHMNASDITLDGFDFNADGAQFDASDGAVFETGGKNVTSATAGSATSSTRKARSWAARQAPALCTSSSTASHSTTSCSAPKASTTNVPSPRRPGS